MVEIILHLRLKYGLVYLEFSQYGSDNVFWYSLADPDSIGEKRS